MWNAGLDEAQVEIKIAGENINNLKYVDDTSLMGESEEELKSILMKVKEKSEKVGLKLNIQKTKIMTSGPITSWQIDGKTMEIVRDYFPGLQNHCRWWLQPWNSKTLAPWKKSYDQPGQHIKNQRHYFAGKDLFSQTIVFLVVMCGCESWTTKKAECPRIDAFELWCWRRLLRVPCTARRSNQSILKKINPGYSLAVLMVKLKLHTLATWFLKNWLIRKDSDAGNDWRQEEKRAPEDETVGWHHWLDGHEFEQALGVGDEQGSLACCSPWGHKELDTTEQLKWTELNCNGIQQVSEGPNVYIATSDWPSNLERYSVKWEFYLSFKTYYLLNIQTTLIYIYLYLTTPPTPQHTHKKKTA